MLPFLGLSCLVVLTFIVFYNALPVDENMFSLFFYACFCLTLNNKIQYKINAQNKNTILNGLPFILQNQDVTMMLIFCTCE